MKLIWLTIGLILYDGLDWMATTSSQRNVCLGCFGDNVWSRTSFLHQKLRGEECKAGDSYYFYKWSSRMNAIPLEFIQPVSPSIILDTECPLFKSMVSAGYPSPAQDYYNSYFNLSINIWFPIPIMSSLSVLTGTSWQAQESLIRICWSWTAPKKLIGKSWLPLSMGS